MGRYNHLSVSDRCYFASIRAPKGDDAKIISKAPHMTTKNDQMTPTEFRAARQALGLSVAEMARLLGYADRQQIRRMELPAEDSTHRVVQPPVALAIHLIREYLTPKQRAKLFAEYVSKARRAHPPACQDR